MTIEGGSLIGWAVAGVPQEGRRGLVTKRAGWRCGLPIGLTGWAAKHGISWPTSEARSRQVPAKAATRSTATRTLGAIIRASLQVSSAGKTPRDGKQAGRGGDRTPTHAALCGGATLAGSQGPARRTAIWRDLGRPWQQIGFAHCYQDERCLGRPQFQVNPRHTSCDLERKFRLRTTASALA